MTPPLRLIFMGTPAFSLPTLKILMNSRHEVAAVYTQPPRPSGRGRQLQKGSVQEYAEAHNIPTFTPATLKEERQVAEFGSHQADVAIVVAYGLILPQKILALPRLGCLNVHASLLPRWRGAAPIHRAVEAGDQETGITIMKMDAGLDTGPMLLKKTLPLDGNSTSASLHEILSVMGSELLLEALEAYAEGVIKPVPQATSGITYAVKLDRKDGQVNWNVPAVDILRKIRAFSPWPGVWFEHGGTRLKIFEAEAVAEAKGIPGTVLDGRLTIACAHGALRIISLQRPGGRILDTPSFLKGYALAVGTRLICPVIN